MTIITEMLLHTETPTFKRNPKEMYNFVTAINKGKRNYFCFAVDLFSHVFSTEQVFSRNIYCGIASVQ